ncbi:TPA: hypothetical protein ACGTLQ_001868 [Salmonella enterica]|nr:hypothetical protein [Salmonella enterica subsp. enterica serovar Orientalis]
MKTDTAGLTMNQLAERNAEHVTTIAALEARCAALSAKLSMINDLMEVAEQANKLAQEAAEKLVQERNALATENAAMKNPDNWLSQSDYGYEAAEVATQNGATEDESLRAGMLAIINRIETPSTDAFLAEVRNEAGARAVELFSQTLGSPYTERDEKCYEDGFTRAIEVVRDVQAPRFAAQLRKGGAS